MDSKPLLKVFKLFYMFLEDAKLFDLIKDAPSVSEMVAQCYHLMTESDVFPKLVPNRKKSDKDSEGSRSNGNTHFKLKEHMMALQLYTQAVGEAATGSAELALAYANRSAVTLALEEYEDAIIDIDRALKGKYPKHLRFKLLERKGKCHALLKSYSKAVVAYEEALKLLESANDKCSNLRESLQDEIKHLRNKTDEYTAVQPMAIPPLTLPPSSYIECASEALEIDYSPEMGRSIVAAKDILPGDVLALEKPYASSLLPTEYLFFCHLCKKRCHSMVPCLNCSYVFYCNEDCRSLSWDCNHRVECDMMPTLIALGYDKMALLAVDVLMKMTKQGDHLKDYIYNEAELHSVESPRLRGFKDGKYSNNETSVYNLEMNHGLRSWNDIFPRLVKTCCLLNLLKSSSYFDAIKKTDENKNLMIFNPLTHAEAIVGALLLKSIFSVSCNAHEVSEMRIYAQKGGKSDSAEIGSGLYPFLSLFNHSCDPNVVRTFYNGDLAVLTAIQAIKKGDQVFDNYGYHHAVHEVSARQESLCSQYFFVCKCQACLENWPMYKNLPEDCIFFDNADKAKVTKEIAHFNGEVKNLQKGTTKEKLSFLCMFLNVLHNSVQRPHKVYSECQEAIKECLMREGNHYLFL